MNLLWFYIVKTNIKHEETLDVRNVFPSVIKFVRQRFAGRITVKQTFQQPWDKEMLINIKSNESRTK